MPDILWLGLIAFGVGILTGAVGIGGILLIPALSAFAGLGVREAKATALFTFTFTGITGTILFQRRGSINWRITMPVCAGALLFSFLGAWANAYTPVNVLSLILAGVIFFAGVYTLASKRSSIAQGQPRRAQRTLLIVIGVVTGFGSGLTGVGGPALSVPLMVLFGFPALASISTSQVIQAIASLSGTLGNLQFGSIDFGIATPITLLQIAGVFAGTRIAHAVDANLLRKSVALLCIAVGAFLIIRLMLH
jgi:uncharacterized membrane protein YfcA